MAALPPPSDPIHQIPTDSSTKPPSSTLDAFYGVLDKLGNLNASSSSGTSQEEASNANTRTSFMTILKYSLIVTAVAVLLALPAVQETMNKMFSSTAVKLGVQAVIIFTLALVLLNRSR